MWSIVRALRLHLTCFLSIISGSFETSLPIHILEVTQSQVPQACYLTRFVLPVNAEMPRFAAERGLILMAAEEETGEDVSDPSPSPGF